MKKCNNCGKEFSVTNQLKDRDWQYKTSGLCARSDNQEGAIPVFLTILQLDTLFDSNDALYTTAMEIKPAGYPISKCETDFIFLSQRGRDYKIQMVIGECKNRKEITKDDVSNLKSVADALEKIGVETFVIFSKLSNFSDEELKLCLSVNDKHTKRLILLTTRELEPYFIYEKTSKEFEFNEYSSSFGEMTLVTEAVFYEKRQKKPATEAEA